MILEGGISKNYNQNWDKNGNIYYTDENGQVVDFKVNPFVKFANKVKATATNIGDWINETNPNSEAYKQKVSAIVGLETLPLGLGATLTGGVARGLTPYVGRKIAQNMAQGIGSGVAGGGIAGGLEAGLNDRNIGLGALKGGFWGLLGGLGGGYGLGKVAQKLNTQTAWHGSPYKFDKFDNAYIGTGEGAQAHGYGHYTAKNKDVADRYREVLSDKPPLYEEYKSLKGHINLLNALNERSPLNDTLKNALKESQEKLMNIEKEYMPEYYLPQGNLYKLSIPKDDVMLRELEPYNEQPKAVQKALREIIKEEFNATPKSKDFETYVGLLNNAREGVLEDSLRLQNKGIKGISYNGGIDGEANVIFNPDDIDIIPYYDNPTSFKEKFINLLNR